MVSSGFFLLCGRLLSASFFVNTYCIEAAFGSDYIGATRVRPVHDVIQNITPWPASLFQDLRTNSRDYFSETRAGCYLCVGAKLSLDGKKLLVIGRRESNGTTNMFETVVKVLNVLDDTFSQLSHDVAKDDVCTLKFADFTNDGNIVVLGYQKDFGGVVEVYKLNGDEWAELGEIVIGSGVLLSFSLLDVAISGSGNRIVTSGRSVANNGNEFMDVRVYFYDNNSWNSNSGGINNGAPLTTSTLGPTVEIADNGYEIIVSTSLVEIYLWNEALKIWILVQDTSFEEERSDTHERTLALTSDATRVVVSGVNETTGFVQIYFTNVSMATGYWFINKPDVTCDSSNTLKVSYSMGPVADAIKLSLYNRYCSSIVDIEHALVSISRKSFVNNVYTFHVYADESKLYDAFSPEDESEILLFFCVNIDLLTTEGEPIISALTSFEVIYDYSLQNGFSCNFAIATSSNEVQTLNPTEYYVKVCQCQMPGTDHFFCTPRDQIITIPQNGFVSVCLKPSSEDVVISNFDLFLTQELLSFQAIRMGSDGPEVTQDFVSLSKFGNIYKVEARVLPAFFESESLSIHIHGTIELEFSNEDPISTSKTSGSAISYTIVIGIETDRGGILITIIDLLYLRWGQLY